LVFDYILPPNKVKKYLAAKAFMISGQNILYLFIEETQQKQEPKQD